MKKFSSVQLLHFTFLHQCCVLCCCEASLFISCLPFSLFLSGAGSLTNVDFFFFLSFFCETLTGISCVCICTHGPLGDSGTVPVQRLLSQSVQTERRTNLQRRCCVFLELDMNKLHRCSRFHKMRILTKEPNRPMQTVIFHVLRGCLYLSKRS